MKITSKTYSTDSSQCNYLSLLLFSLSLGLTLTNTVSIFNIASPPFFSLSSLFRQHNGTTRTQILVSQIAYHKSKNYTRRLSDKNGISFASDLLYRNRSFVGFFRLIVDIVYSLFRCDIGFCYISIGINRRWNQANRKNESAYNVFSWNAPFRPLFVIPLKIFL